MEVFQLARDLPPLSLCPFVPLSLCPSVPLPLLAHFLNNPRFCCRPQWPINFYHNWHFSFVNVSFMMGEIAKGALTNEKNRL
jgi:hypothetical protein